METIRQASQIGHIPGHTLDAIMEFENRVRSWYGDRLDKIILYGSYARGDYNDDSDIDLLIVLNDNTISRLQEIENLSYLKYDMMIQYGVFFSAKAITSRAFEEGKSAISYFIRKEGITL